MKTIVFYYHNFGGLGHLTRIYNISLQLVENFGHEYKVIILNSGKKQTLKDIDSRISLIHLPEYDVSEYQISDTPSNNSVMKLRRALYEKLFQKLDVSKLIVEHFPFGRNFLSSEIQNICSICKRENIGAHIFSSLRDIHDADSLNIENLDIFDRFLVHADENYQNVLSLFPEHLRHKVFLTGVVIPQKLKELPDISDSNHILVTIGGGQDGIEYVKDFLEKISQTHYSGKLYVSLGNMYSEEISKDLSELYKQEIIIKDFFDDFLELKKSSKLVVSMGGYNNFYENISLGKISIIYPRSTDTEQGDRLEIFKKSTGLYKGLTLTHTSLQDVLDNDEEILSDINFNGSYASASFIALFGKHKYIKIRLLNACNVECDMCGVIRRPIQKNDLASLIKVIEEFYLIGGEVVNFTGGEPTIFKGFYELLDVVKSLGMITSVSTNGATLGKEFYSSITKNYNTSIDFMDISVDALGKQHDIIRAKLGLFHIIKKNLQVVKKLGINLHINVTIRKDNMNQLEKIYDFFACYKIDSISFSMIDSSPFHDVTDLYPSYEQLLHFYEETVPNLQNKTGIENISISPLQGNKSTDELIQGILDKHNYPRVSGEKCPFISAMSEIRVNENGAISPCCEMDDYDEDIGNINTAPLVNIIHSKEYYKFINTTYPSISKACSSCKIVV